MRGLACRIGEHESSLGGAGWEAGTTAGRYTIGMAKPVSYITPPDRVDRWKKLWATPRKLDDANTEAAFDEFMDAFVPRHMQKKFASTFGVQKAMFNNRFFMEDATFQNWMSKLSSLVGFDGEHIEVTVMYASPDAVEAYVLRGDRRRTLKDFLIDDWHAACAIARAGTRTLYIFIQPRMRGCMLRKVGVEPEEEGMPAGEEFFEG